MIDWLWAHGLLIYGVSALVGLFGMGAIDRDRKFEDYGPMELMAAAMWPLALLIGLVWLVRGAGAFAGRRLFKENGK